MLILVGAGVGVLCALAYATIYTNAMPGLLWWPLARKSLTFCVTAGIAGGFVAQTYSTWPIVAQLTIIAAGASAFFLGFLYLVHGHRCTGCKAVLSKSHWVVLSVAAVAFIVTMFFEIITPGATPPIW